MALGIRRQIEKLHEAEREIRNDLTDTSQAKRRQSPDASANRCGPLSSNVIPEPATRSLTVFAITVLSEHRQQRRQKDGDKLNTNEKRQVPVYLPLNFIKTGEPWRARTSDPLIKSAFTHTLAGDGFSDLLTSVKGCSRQRVCLLMPIDSSLSVFWSQVGHQTPSLRRCLLLFTTSDEITVSSASSACERTTIPPGNPNQ